MTEKSPINLDRALYALAERARTASPRVSDRLRARVLGDAAEMAQAEQSRASAMRPQTGPRPAAARGWLFGLVDAWSGAAVAAVVLGLIAGLGLGYEAGAELMAEVGFGETTVASAARDGDGLFIPEDVL